MRLKNCETSSLNETTPFVAAQSDAFSTASLASPVSRLSSSVVSVPLLLSAWSTFLSFSCSLSATSLGFIGLTNLHHTVNR